MDWQRIIDTEKESYDPESWKNFVRRRLERTRDNLREMQDDLDRGRKELDAWEMEAVHINLDGALFNHE